MHASSVPEFSSITHGILEGRRDLCICSFTHSLSCAQDPSLPDDWLACRSPRSRSKNSEAAGGKQSKPPRDAISWQAWKAPGDARLRPQEPLNGHRSRHMNGHRSGPGSSRFSRPISRSRSPPRSRMARPMAVPIRAERPISPPRGRHPLPPRDVWRAPRLLSPPPP